MRVLVLRALGLGDLLTAVPALRGLRAAFPRAEITLAAPAWLRDAVDRIDAVDRLLPTEELAPIDFERPDLAVNLHGKGPQSVERLMATRPRELITCERWDPERHEVLRWCDLLERHDIPCDPDDLHLPVVGAQTERSATGTRTGLSAAGSRTERSATGPRAELPASGPRTGRIVIHPGASTGARRWPPERYAAVARELGPEVVVTAGPGEQDLARQITPNPVSGSLAGLMDLVATARLVICGDTGVAHVATAYGTPSVILFGPVSPDLWGPRHGPHKVLWHGHTGDTFADEPDPGLLRITVAEVLDAAGGVLCRESELSERVTSA